MTEKAYVTLVATDSYAAGALVLAHRLRDMGSTYDLICLVTKDLSDTVLEHLSQLYKVVRVDTLTSNDQENLALLGRPELNITFTKLHLWNLTEYKKLVFLDADTLPLRNIDDLFDRPNFSAAPDAGWPDCFNSGVFVTEPSETDYHGLKKMATEQGSFDGGDQGLLNTYFKSWSTSSTDHRLPFTYNTTPTSQYSYAPAHQYYVNNIAICHFIGLDKPWKYQRLADGNVLSHGWKGLTDLVQSWWDTWNLYYGQNQPHLLLSRSPKDTLIHSHSTQPIKLFSQPIVNAWDTPNISDGIELYEQHRHTDSMPPIANITISTPKWASQEVNTTHLYPVSSESHTMDSYFDDTSQYSSVDCNDHGYDDVAPNADKIPDYQDTQHEHHTSHNNDSDNNNNNNNNNNDAVYQTIEWNPACESPPNTGIAANIPDLSLFVNAWDQPFQDQPIWIAPEPQPIPKMDFDYGFVHENQPHHEQQHQFNETSEHQNQHHYQSIFPWEQPVVQQTPDTTRIWIDEQYHMTPTDDYNKGESSQTMDEYKEDTFHHHVDHQHHNNEHEEDSCHHHHHHLSDDRHYHDEGTYDRTRDLTAPDQQYETCHHDTLETQIVEQSSPYDENQHVESESQTYAMDLMAASTVSPGRSPRASMHFAQAGNNQQQEEYDWSDRDLIPIQLKRSSKLNIEGLSPSVPQSPIGSRRGSLSKSRRSSISSLGRQRVTTAPGSPSGSFTPPATTKNGPRATQTDYSLYSRQPSSLFAQENVSYSTKKTPYTSAATTPVREKMSFFDDMDDEQEYITTYQENDSVDDFVLDYSFDEPLMMASVTDRDYRQLLFGEQPEWNPQEALDRLKDTSETIMRSYGQQQQQQEEQQQGEQLPIEEIHLDLDEYTSRHRDSGNNNNNKASSDIHYALDTITLSVLPQEDRPFYSSGSSSPRTPVIRGLDSNMMAEIEAAREQHRQHQRAALSLQQPHTAVATLLEVELDLSKSSLFNRRHDHNNNNSNSSGSAHLTYDEPSSSSRAINYYTEPTGSGYNNYSSAMGTPMNLETRYLYDEDEDHSTADAFTSYFDTSIIETARRKLNALTQDVSVTSMSSTDTVNETYDEDETQDPITTTSSYGATLADLSRYSFPPVLYEYSSSYPMASTAVDTTTTNTTITSTFEERDPLELASSSSSTLQETIDHHHDSDEQLGHDSDEGRMIRLIEQNLDDDDDDDDEYDGYDRISVLVDDDEQGIPYDHISISVDDDDDDDARSTGGNYGQITLSTDEDKPSTSDPYDRISLSEGDEEEHTATSVGRSYDRVSISVDSDDDVEGYWHGDTNQTIATWLSLTSSSMAAASTTDDGIDDDTTMERITSQSTNCGSLNENNDIITGTIDCVTEEQVEDESIGRSGTTHTHTRVEIDDDDDDDDGVACLSLLDSNEMECMTPTVSSTAPLTTTTVTSTELSTSAVAMLPSIRESVASASDDSSDVAFLSAVDGTISTSDSLSLGSSSDWYTVHSSTPDPNHSDDDNGDDDEYGEQEHEAALSLLEINMNKRMELSTIVHHAASSRSTTTTTTTTADIVPSSTRIIPPDHVDSDFSHAENNDISDSISVESDLTETGKT